MSQLKLIRHFDLSLLLIMKTNILDYTTTVVLLQKNELLTSMLKKIIVIKQNYRITKKEMLTIV